MTHSRFPTAKAAVVAVLLAGLCYALNWFSILAVRASWDEPPSGLALKGLVLPLIVFGTFSNPTHLDLGVNSCLYGMLASWSFFHFRTRRAAGAPLLQIRLGTILILVLGIALLGAEYRHRQTAPHFEDRENWCLNEVRNSFETIAFMKKYVEVHRRRAVDPSLGLMERSEAEGEVGYGVRMAEDAKVRSPAMCEHAAHFGRLKARNWTEKYVLFAFLLLIVGRFLRSRRKRRHPNWPGSHDEDATDAPLRPA